MYHVDDTIAAIASADGGAARGIVRLSGPEVVRIVYACLKLPHHVDLDAICRPTALVAEMILAAPFAGELSAQVYFWPGQRSYTRQPVAEIHTIGSQPLLGAVLEEVCAAGARLAQPGEFTLRAFLAGRLDLTQAEAVLGIIDARGADEFRTALAQLAGGVAQPLHRVRDSLLNLLAHLEAGLDFVEEDIEFISGAEIEKDLELAHLELAQLAAQLQSRRRDDALPRAVLAGWPNVGKSSLFNALANQGCALISNEPGTTRDYLTAVLDLEGARCYLIDTAGVEPDAPDGIAATAQALAAKQVDNSEMRVLCLDSERAPNEWERRQLTLEHAGQRQIVVLTKCESPNRTVRLPGAIETSAKTGQGLPELRKCLREAVLRAASNELSAGMTAERCAESIREAMESLGRANLLNSSRAGDELIAAEMRVALAEVGKMVGAVYTDDLLDRIFSRFCIGK